MANDVLDDMMGYDPKNLSVFDEPVNTSNDNANVYKTRPRDTKSEDGIYRSKIRVLYNPFDIRNSIVKSVTYNIHDADGFQLVPSALSINDKNCPIFKAFSSMWWSNDRQEKKREFIKNERVFDKSESNYSLIQILEDDNQPELVGKYMFYKIPRAVMDKMNSKMAPSVESKRVPIPMMDYLRGRALDLEVQPGPDDPINPSRKTREISYDLSEFNMEDGICPVIKVDGTPLFTDEEIESIQTYDKFVMAALKKQNVTEREGALAKLSAHEVTTQMRELMKKAIDYIKENSLNVSEELSFKPWDDATTQRVARYLALVNDLQLPWRTSSADVTAAAANSFVHAPNTGGGKDPLFDSFPGVEDGDDDLPF